jgi:hypothetical protein
MVFVLVGYDQQIDVTLAVNRWQERLEGRDGFGQIFGTAQRPAVDQDVKIPATLVSFRDTAINAIAKAYVEQPD